MHWFMRSPSLSFDGLLSLLQRELPLCFSDEPKPLAYNIKKALLDYYCNETRFTPQALISALQHYMSSHEYLNALKLDALRVDIYGNTAGVVTQQEAQQAKMLLNRAGKLANPLKLLRCENTNNNNFIAMSA